MFVDGDEVRCVKKAVAAEGENLGVGHGKKLPDSYVQLIGHSGIHQQVHLPFDLVVPREDDNFPAFLRDTKTHVRHLLPGCCIGTGFIIFTSQMQIPSGANPAPFIVSRILKIRFPPKDGLQESLQLHQTEISGVDAESVSHTGTLCLQNAEYP